MKFLSGAIAAAFLAMSVPTFGSVILTFDVSVNNKFLNDTSSNPGLSFHYSVTVDFDSIVTDQGTYDSGSSYFFEHFNSPSMATTPLTNDVISHYQGEVGAYNQDINDWRSATSGDSFTEEKMQLGYNLTSQSGGNTYTYGLLLELAANPTGYQVTPLTESTFTSYMSSLIGQSVFTFNQSTGIEDTTTTAQSYNYGYSGNATLLSVTPVPEPGALALLGLGVVALAFWRKKA